MIEDSSTKKSNTFFWVILASIVVLIIGYFYVRSDEPVTVEPTESDILRALSNASGGFSADAGSSGTSIVGTTIETDDDPYFGSKDAKVRIVEFGDFECPFCKEMHDTVKQLEAQFGNEIFFQYRDFPVVLSHPNAVNAAIAAECAYKQGRAHFWSYHDRLYQFQDELSDSLYPSLAERIGLDLVAFNVCFNAKETKSEVEADYTDGLAAGVPGTPTFFINGYRVPGVIPQETLFGVINQLLASTS